MAARVTKATPAKIAEVFAIGYRVLPPPNGIPTDSSGLHGESLGPEQLLFGCRSPEYIERRCNLPLRRGAHRPTPQSLALRYCAALLESKVPINAQRSLPEIET